jgi:hypothetical protein
MMIVNDRVAQLHAKDVGRTFTSSDLIKVPVTDTSGLKVEVSLSPEAAHRLVADLKMTLLCSALTSHPRLVAMPKAPISIDVNSWSTGCINLSKSVILRLEGALGEMVDAKFSAHSINDVADHIKQSVHL